MGGNQILEKREWIQCYIYIFFLYGQTAICIRDRLNHSWSWMKNIVDVT